MTETPASELPRSAAEARALGSKTYFTGKPCKNGHVAPRRTERSVCTECLKGHYKRWRKENRDKNLAYRRELYARHREKLSQKALERYRANKDARLEYASRWRKRNGDKLLSYAIKRDRRISRATPNWVDEKEIAAIYAEARRRTIETGVKHHVDHIVPFQGKIASGLQVQWNLRVVTWMENTSKNNRMPDDEDCVAAKEVILSRLVARPD